MRPLGEILDRAQERKWKRNYRGYRHPAKKAQTVHNSPEGTPDNNKDEDGDDNDTGESEE